MATSKWFSSIAGIESRLRRSLQISGPINLALEDPPRLVPVMLCDDATRPGCATDTGLRGRRFALSLFSSGIGVGARGCVFFGCSSITANANEAAGKGGVVIDYLDVSWSASGAVSERIMTEVRMSAQFEVQPAVSLRDGWLTDPIGAIGIPGTAEQAPLFVGQSAVVPAAGFGNRIWQGDIGNGQIAGSPNRFVIPTDWFLREQGYVVIGNTLGLVNGATLFINVRGRAF